MDIYKGTVKHNGFWLVTVFTVEFREELGNLERECSSEKEKLIGVFIGGGRN